MITHNESDSLFWTIFIYPNLVKGHQMNTDKHLLDDRKLNQ